MAEFLDFAAFRINHFGKIRERKKFLRRRIYNFGVNFNQIDYNQGSSKRIFYSNCKPDEAFIVMERARREGYVNLDVETIAFEANGEFRIPHYFSVWGTAPLK